MAYSNFIRASLSLCRSEPITDPDHCNFWNVQYTIVSADIIRVNWTEITSRSDRYHTPHDAAQALATYLRSNQCGGCVNKIERNLSIRRYPYPAAVSLVNSFITDFVATSEKEDHDTEPDYPANCRFVPG